MADPSPDQHPNSSTPIARLSPEMIARIFEELHDIAPHSVVTARLVCRAFDAFATPVVYQTVRVNEQIVEPSASELFPQAFQHMGRYTRHVVLRSGLNRQHVVDFLNHFERLRSIRYICLPLLSERPGLTTPDLRWSFISNTGPSTHLWVPSDIAYLKTKDPSKIKIHIQDLPIGALDGKYSDHYGSVIPNNLLGSLETVSQLTVSDPFLPSLKDLLLRSRSMEVFRYRDSGPGTHFQFKDGERLPPFEELTLRAYQWNHDAYETARHWDFSRIRSLDLLSIPVFSFLSAVTLSDFDKLHTLRVDDAGTDKNRDRRKVVTAMLYRLVKNHIRVLSSLEITCYIDSFSIDALLAHSRTLRNLIFRDHAAFSEDYQPSPTLSISQLTRLSENMTVLQTLELDVDATDKRFSRFLLVLRAFPQLTMLTLNIQTVAESDAWYTRFADPDEKCAERIFKVLTKRRAGPAQWARITIKVGSYQSLMVWRVGEIWRSLNRRGIFAKRCFIMERAGGKEDGELVVREQRYVEMRLGRGYPWPG